MAASVQCDKAVQYLRKHGVPDLIDGAVRELISKGASDPVDFLQHYFQDLIHQRSAQFTKGAEVEVSGMAIDKSLNGQVGKIIGKQDDVMVNFGAPIGLRQVKTSNLRPVSGCVAAVGDEVEAVNMTLSKDMNGKRGVVKGFLTKVFLKMNDGEMRALPQSNLRVVTSDDVSAVVELEKGAEVEVCNMVIDTSMNGKKGVVKRREDTVVVRVEEIGMRQLSTLNVKPVAEGGKLEPGAEVVIHKMVLDKAINEKKAVVKRLVCKIYVAFPDIGVKAFPVAALKRIG